MFGKNLVNPLGPGAFCFGKGIILDRISLIHIDIFILSTSHVSSGRFCLQGIGPFHLGYQISTHRVTHSISLSDF